jgi:two-component system chemotaxis response regulator CheB
MANRNLVVVGASFGGIEVLQNLLAALPVNLDAAVLCVLHLAPSSPNYLPLHL